MGLDQTHSNLQPAVHEGFERGLNRVLIGKVSRTRGEKGALWSGSGTSQQGCSSQAQGLKGNHAAQSTWSRRRLLLEVKEQSGVVLVSDMMFVVIPRSDPAVDSSTSRICLHGRYNAPWPLRRRARTLSTRQQRRGFIERTCLKMNMLAVSHAGLRLGLTYACTRTLMSQLHQRGGVHTRAWFDQDYTDSRIRVRTYRVTLGLENVQVVHLPKAHAKCGSVLCRENNCDLLLLV